LSLPLTNYHKNLQNPIAQKLRHTCNVKHAFAYLKYYRKGIAQKILKQLKYNGNGELGILVGHWFGEELLIGGMGSSFDIVVPIPLHHLKLRRRGYNQSEKITEGLTEVLQAEHLPHLLKRSVYTQTQTHKGMSERWTTTQHIFELGEMPDLSEKHVLILDDVITTGATVESAVNCLWQAKPKAISVCALASGQ
jgi:ComF family protein